jgi:L-amino acid N-acyltransferase YncA
MNHRIIDEDIILVPYFPNENETYQWYQNREICKQVDNIDETYSMEKLQAMYRYLSTHGDCYYIKYRGILVGDVSLKDDAEVSIVICKEYQNKHIGRRCIKEIIKLASEKGMKEIKAQIYSFNLQSKKMFLHAGFTQQDEEWYIYSLK